MRGINEHNLATILQVFSNSAVLARFLTPVCHQMMLRKSCSVFIVNSSLDRVTRSLLGFAVNLSLSKYLMQILLSFCR